MAESILTTSEQKSPFDRIRRFRADGSEYWTGRELQKMLGYSKWESFGAKEQKTANTSKTGNSKVSTICRAMVSCITPGHVIEDNFKHFLSSGTQYDSTPEDWHLSRFACYLVAMCGDVTKPEIAAAQAYFAVKTREAEVIIPAQNDRLRELELENENLKLRADVYGYRVDRLLSKYIQTKIGAIEWQIIKKFAN